MLNRLRKNNSEGFTIIEVMIVLAIAGLILLIVFLAVPALQRNARNTQRKNDAASYSAAVSEDTNNNNGVIPTSAGAAVNAVKAGQLTTINYAVGPTFTTITAPAVGTVYIRNNSVCGSGGGGQIGLTGGTIRQSTVSYLIESPGAAVAGFPGGYIAQCVSST